MVTTIDGNLEAGDDEAVEHAGDDADREPDDDEDRRRRARDRRRAHRR